MRALNRSHSADMGSTRWDWGTRLPQLTDRPRAPNSLTKEGGRRHGAVAARDHDADARLHEGDREVYDLGPLLVYGERADGHVRALVEHLVSEAGRLKQVEAARLSREETSDGVRETLTRMAQGKGA